MASDPHPVRITGTIELSDGSESSFSVQADQGWQQWGNDTRKLGTTVDLMEGLAAAAHEAGLREPDES